MVRIVRPTSALAFFAAALAFATFTCARAFAAPDGDDPSGEAQRLTASGDFNRDGVTDIAEVTLPGTGRPGPASLSISLGNPDGSFQPLPLRLPVGASPHAIVAGDFNGDGIPDLIVGDDDGTLLLFRGDGSGKMITAGEIGRLGSVTSIAVADFNHDGILDLAISDWRGSTVNVLFGDGSGAFHRVWSSPLRMPGSIAHVAVADFNGDNLPDLAIVYGGEDGDTFDVMVGDGKGEFTNAPGLSFVRDPNSHCVT